MDIASAGYISTRGGIEPIGFSDAVMTGLAPDGGLLLPEKIPDVQQELEEWRALSYPKLAEKVIQKFIGDELRPHTLRNLIQNSYARFDAEEVVPITEADDVYIAELFHGPTMAFKDLALQFLGNLFEYLLEQREDHLNVIGATSGDTGSAAIQGIRGKDNMNVFILFPEGRISKVQERQMTSVRDGNVHAVGVEGTFDDTQRLLKELFSDLDFKEQYRLGAVNSVNWARIVAQIVYYFYSAFRVQDKNGKSPVQVVVPTGNFGNIFAGYLAHRMGAPIDRLILATNENNILKRFFQEGIYKKGRVTPTLSPSMDIQVASNFERYLYYRCGEDAAQVQQLMEDFRRNGRIQLSGEDPLFASGTATREDTLRIMHRFYDEHHTLVDPHTAVGLSVAEQNRDPHLPTVCLATAHPAKFPEAVKLALGTAEPAKHPGLDTIHEAPARHAVIAPEKSAVADYIRSAVEH